MDIYHSTLMSIPEITRRSGDCKPLHRDVGETSARSMLTDAAGLIYISAMIGDNFPPDYHFDKSIAGKGLFLSRDVLA